MNVDLTTERQRLERQIEELRSAIDAAAARLDVVREERPRARGFLVGFAIGGALVFAGAVAGIVFAIATIGRID